MKNVLTTRVFLLSVLLSSLLIAPFILDLTLTPRFISCAICLAVAAYLFWKSELKVNIDFDLVLLSYTAYTVFSCLSVFWSNTRSECLFESSKQVLALFIFLVTYFILTKEKEYFMEKLMKLSVIVFIVTLSVAGYQFIKIEDFNREALYLITGLNGHKNLFASFLFLNLYFLICGHFKLKKEWKNAALVCIALNLVVLFLLKTKAVWIGTVVAFVLFLVLNVYRSDKRESKFKPGLLLILPFFLIIINVFFFRLLQPVIHKSINYVEQVNAASTGNHAIKSEEERLILWDKTYHQIKQHPVAGVGMGNWQVYFPDATLSALYRAEDLNYTFQRPHNDFLWVLSETGFIGFNLFLVFLLSILFLLIKTLSFVQEDRDLGFNLVLCISFIAGYFTLSFFDFPKERIEHTVWINVLLGIAYFQIKSFYPLKNYARLQTSKTLKLSALGLLILISLIGVLRFNGEFHTRRMLNYKNTGQMPQLIESATSALSFAYCIDPTSVPLHWYMGNANAALGNYKEAQKDFLQALKFNPYNRNVLNDLASSYVFNDNVLLAKKYYEEAARISPRFDEPKLNLAAMYINAKDYKTAGTWLNSIMHDSERRTKYQRILDRNK